VTTLYEHYQACTLRGHEADMYVTQGTWETKSRCKHCKTWFWTEKIEHEEGAPDPDGGGQDQ